MSIIGQRKILSLIDKWTLANKIPTFILLVGQKGQGKKTIADYLIYVNNLSKYTPKELKVDDIRMMSEYAQTLYDKTAFLLADADVMTVAAQNALLKFAEEPPPNAYIIMTASSRENVLETILSRAHVLTLSSYSRTELQEYTSNKQYLSIFDNIGQIKRAETYNFEKLYKTAQTIADNINILNTANTFNILKHFSIDDADVFIMILLSVYEKKLSTSINGRLSLLNQVRIIYKYKQQLSLTGINKANALEMMFIEMKGA